MKKKSIYNLVLSAMFLAIGIALPQVVKMIPIPRVGEILLPMHIPVLLCGFVCGYRYGLSVGLLVPILSSVFFSMPPMYPVAISMAFELGTYGLIAGIMYMVLSKKVRNQFVRIIITLITSMLAGRVVMGIANTFLITNGNYGLKAFIAGAFVTALPGIIAQLIIIPVIIMTLRKAKLLK